ncbi:MAG: hypothetical protein HYU02_08145 [Thaumarchaeota archaeon]|nr:hypothetical protein [Nitrososphaerota archaeon]
MSPEGKVEVPLGYLKREHLSKFQRFEQSYFSKSKVWLWTGLSIILFGLVLMTIRDLNELNFINLLLLGVNPNPLSGLFGSSIVESFRQTITTETIIQHSIEQILLLAMSILKLAIGGFIFLIVQNLVATRKYVITKAQAGGVPIEEEPKTPFFAKIFPLLLILGTDIQFFNVGILMTIWDLNALNILGMQFAGTATGADFQSAVFIEQLIGSLVVPVEMAGAAMMLAGIPLGLATIVVNLRMQGKMLPMVLSDIISRRTSPQEIRELGTRVAGTPKIDPSNNAEGIAPQKIVILTMLGFLFGISGLVVFSPIRVANVVAIVNESFYPMASTGLNSLKLFDSIMAITVEQFLFVGLGVVVFAINIFLLQIIKALRAQRKFFEETLESTIGTQLTPLENPLWTTR